MPEEHGKVGAPALTEETPASGAEGNAPPYQELKNGRLRQLLAYGRKVYGLRALLTGVGDDRRPSAKGKGVVAAIVFFCGLLRVRSFNALEPRLKETNFLRLIGAASVDKPLASIDTVSRALCRSRPEDIRRVSESIVAKAERNKVFREGWIGSFRYVALDGWEPFSSYHRHCGSCLEREITFKNSDGTERAAVQYYHRYVVAMLIDDRFDLFLDMEPQLPADQRADQKKDVHEGEQTAAIRLLKRVKQTFHWLDVVVGDALYSNGPFLTEVAALKMGAVLIAKKESDEPLKEAFHLWSGRPPDDILKIERKSADGRLLGYEHQELWSCSDLETLDSYQGKIRVVRAQVTRLVADAPSSAPASTWCMLVTGAPTRLSSRQVLAVGRGRWHLENTGFHQWTSRWQLGHVFVHDEVGTPALIRLFLAAYDLLTLFLYTQVRSYGRDRGKDVTRTISRFVDELLDELACLPRSPWDTS